MPLKNPEIRNFCIIAHIDHGKSTLADRMLELTNTITSTSKNSQVLDDMDLEKERGITIKSHPIQMNFKYKNNDYILNLIDTPGHVDFTYEVSRSMAACEGALLLIDSTQGVEAQTVSNAYLALDSNLEIIPILNKIDMKNSNILESKTQVCELLGVDKDNILSISAKSGEGVEEIFTSIIEDILPPKSYASDKLKALIFDSYFDQYRGVVVYVKVVAGKISKKTLWSIIKNCELTEKDEFKISQYCKDKKIIFLSTPFSIEAVDRLEKIRMPAYKIGSGELTNIPFLKYIAKIRKPVILSTGMSEMNEIKSAVSLFKKHKVPLALLQTTSVYPSDYGDINLGVIAQYSKIFNVPVGISDHSIGIYTALGAVAKGASIVEKHITLDKKMPGPDQRLSLEPIELKELVKGCRAIKLALGNSKKILKKELPVLRFARESVVAKTKIRKHEIFSEKNLTTKRPNTGQIPAKNFYKILGKKAKKDIPESKQLSYSDIT